MAAARKSSARATGSQTRSGTAEKNSTARRKSSGTATRKNTSGRKTTSNGKNSAGRKSTAGGRKSSGAGNTARQHKRTADEINTYKDQLAFETGITILVLSIISIFFYLCFLGVCGKIGIVLTGIHFGLFGWISWLMPAMIVISYVFAVVNAGDRRVPRKIISGGVLMVLLGALTELIFQQEILTEYFTSNHVLHHEYFKCLYMSLEDVAKHGKGSGGIIGRGIGTALSSVIGKGGAAVVLLGLILLCAYIFHGLEMMASLRKKNAYKEQMEEEYDRFVQEENDYREPSYRVIPKSRRADQAAASRAGVTLQAVDLQAAGRRLDEIEAREKQERIAAKEQKEKLKKLEKEKKKEQTAAAKAWEAAKPENQKETPELSIPVGMQEIIGEENSASEFDVMQERPEPQKAMADVENKPAVSVSEPLAKEPVSEKKSEMDIPIYREEMNHKFRSVAGAAPDTEAAGQKPAAAGAGAVLAGEPVSTASEVSSNVPGSVPRKKSAPKKQSSHGRIGGDDYVSNSDTFNALNDSKVENETIPYQFPPIDLLSLPTKQESSGASDKDLRETAMRLKDTLQSFNVEVEMGAVTCGPTVTRYEVLPAQGVRVNKITNLADDLKLSLAAPSIRIEAPIPGKSAVGIEVPNEKPSSVHFRELLEGEAFEKAKSPVAFAVGKDIGGKVIVTDIAKMPHLLIAGATGSGKSVCINTLIMSILYKSDPNEVKLIMIDPKVVELSCYNGIPHLYCPVVTDPKEAAASLNWAVREMMDRYNKFKELGVRNIAGYNEKIKSVENAEAAGYTHMPLLVIIVDEFADLMMVASKEVEDAVCRLAQLARAAGIHLILATQRPSVNVITGVIKANIPSRIAFSVSSAIDSRTILDKGGAEKLLGKGDMLFFPSGYSEPVRLQGAFVSDKEVSDVVAFLCNNNETPVYNDKVTEIVDIPAGADSTSEDKKSDVDEYFEDAGRFVIDSGRAAAGQLQRKFSIGFNRAGRIIDQLNKAGVVGPAVGTKPRQVLMTMEQFEVYLGHGDSTGEAASEDEFALAQEFADQEEAGNAE
ncbi:DNA translocase FtsK [Jutongia sp.]|uniref:DNA translocase FtsK n=1 Tax=Jutongia sp. TaxID=2944204 RepID=UPI0030793352